MSEGNPDTAILVAISFQAMQRLDRLRQETTRVADTTVMLFFAAVYLEGTIDYIVSASRKKQSMLKFLDQRKVPKRKSKKRRRPFAPGMRLKLAWFHNECIASKRCADWGSLKSKVGVRLRNLFPGFRRLHAFRNKVAHGHIEEVDVAEAKALRDATKVAVNRLYDAAEEAWDKHIERITTYKAATKALRRYASSGV